MVNEKTRGQRSALVDIAAGGLGIYSVAQAAYGDNGGHYNNNTAFDNVAGEVVTNVSIPHVFDSSCSGMEVGSELAAINKWRPGDSVVRVSSHIHLDHSPVDGETTNLTYTFIEPQTLTNGQSTPIHATAVSYWDNDVSKSMATFTQGRSNTLGSVTNRIAYDGISNLTTAVSVPIYDAMNDFEKMAIPGSNNVISTIPESGLMGLAMFGAMAYSFVRGKINPRKRK